MHNNLVLARVTKQVLVFIISNQKMTFEGWKNSSNKTPNKSPKKSTKK